MREYTKRLILKLFKKLERYPRVLIFIFPGQPPGRYFEEHDRRIRKAIEVLIDCQGLPCWETILCTSGPRDIKGTTCAKYMRSQLLLFAFTKYSQDIARFIKIGEEASASTAQQIILAKANILEHKPDLVILVSNRPHLLVAGSYFKHIIPGVRFVKEWSVPCNGCIGMKKGPFILREVIHYLVSMTIDRSGHRLDELTKKSIAKWQQLFYPHIPPLQD